MIVLYLIMLTLISFDANAQETESRKFLHKVKDWIFDLINKPFPQNGQKPYMKTEKNVRHLLQKVPCHKVGAKKR